MAKYLTKIGHRNHQLRDTGDRDRKITDEDMIGGEGSSSHESKIRKRGEG